ncbi:MAG: ribB, partial [Pseudarthrobacter sp.]|nr:ribB [Pseudarthrobacter sp.]
MNAAVRFEPEVAPAASTRTDKAPGLNTIEEAVRAMAAGRPVRAVDNEDRENEGDIIFAAQHATPALMGWTIRYSSGVICVPRSGDRADAL